MRKDKVSDQAGVRLGKDKVREKVKDQVGLMPEDAKG